MADLAIAEGRAMGGSVSVVVVGGPAGLTGRALARLAELEACWTRFSDTSELSQLNDAAGGGPRTVSPDLFALVEAMMRGFRLTGGRYDATVLDALEAAGYDRTFAELARAGAGRGSQRPAVAAPTPAPGMARVLLDPATRAVTLARGVRLDPGGIGKGLAADLVVAELLAAGARGACVVVDGDLVADGEPPDGSGWLVEVDQPGEPGRTLARAAVRRAGVATSGTGVKRWVFDGERRHHLIDPRTGAPATEEVVQATVAARRGADAEAWATAALVGGVAWADRHLRSELLDAVLVDASARIHVIGHLFSEEPS